MLHLSVQDEPNRYKAAKEVPQNNPSVSKDKDRDEVTLKALPNRQGSFQKKNDQNQNQNENENKNADENSNSSGSCRNNSNSSDIKSERSFIVEDKGRGGKRRGEKGDFI